MRGGVLEAAWDRAAGFEDFLAGTEENTALWRALQQRASLPEGTAARLDGLDTLRLLVIADDWCGDAVNTVPVVARLAETAGIELRVIGREEAPEVMDAHRTGTSRSIPVVILLDADGRELGWWGPRPAPLQAWVMETGLTLSPKDRYLQVRSWYARDRGRTTVDELLAVFDDARMTVG